MLTCTKSSLAKMANLEYSREAEGLLKKPSENQRNGVTN
jgi:hypothetical protein